MVATCVASVLLVLSGLHLYWAAGGRGPSAATVPQVDGRPAFVPGTVATLLVAAALACAAAIVLVRAGVWSAPPVLATLAGWGAWVLAVVFLGRALGDFRLVGFTKRVRGTAFARRDTALYSPLCAALGLAILWIATR
jgi:Protein of unknown function (DUF3995)